MSGKDLIDDYLSELMDDPGKGKPAAPGPLTHRAETTDPQQEAAAPSAAVQAPDPLDAPAADPRAEPAPPEPAADSATAEQAVSASDVAAEPAADPLAAFRGGAPTIGDDEFEAMLDAMQGKPATDAQAAMPTAAGDPLEAFRSGPATIGDDEFDAMLDALKGTPGAAAATPAAAAAPAAVAAPPARAAPISTPAPAPAIAALLPPSTPASAPSEGPLASERRSRRADDRITSWLRFSLARQHFAVEVLKVQEVLRVPLILPVRGTAEAMLGVMNLRGQIVPVMDLAIKLGFSPTEANDASRVIVLEEHGETLGLLVAAVADVVNLSDGKMERISGTPSLVAAEVVRGISRRDGQIVIMLDATRLLA